MTRKSPLAEKKIAIVGCYPDHWEKAPFEDPSWEIWGFSRRNMGLLPRQDKWFELHSPSKFESYDRDVKGYQAWLKRDNTVTQANFPRDELIKKFGPFFFDGGQAAWMLAYAISLRPTTIGLWGVECKDKYAPQRLCIQHFIQIAKDQGVKIIVPANCTLLEPRPFYGFPQAPAK